MARISIDLKRIGSADQLLQYTQLELAEIESELSAVYHGLSPAIRSRYNIGNDLRQLLSDIETLHNQVNCLRQVSKAAITSYRTAEHQIAFYVPDDKR